MRSRLPFASLALFVGFFQLSSTSAVAQELSQLCHPVLTAPITVATPGQRLAAGAKVEPPLTDTFDWPDTPLGVIKTANGYEFFGSDGGYHARQMWQGRWYGNNKWGSFTNTSGTLDNPLGTGAPEDTSVSRDPNPSINPIYPSYGYMGGGPVFKFPRECPAPAIFSRPITPSCLTTPCMPLLASLLPPITAALDRPRRNHSSEPGVFRRTRRLRNR